MPSTWPPRAGTAPGPPGHSDCLGASTQRLPPKGAGRRGVGGAVHGGPCQSPPCHNATPGNGNAAVTVPQGSIKGGTHQCPAARAAPGAARRHLRGREGGITGRGLREEDWSLVEAARGSLLQGQLLAGHLQISSDGWRCPRLSGCFRWRVVASPRECLLEEHCRSSPSSSPAEPGAAAVRNGVQGCCQGSQCFGAAARQAQERFWPPRSIRPGAFGHSRKPLRWLQGEGEQGLGISWEA